MKSSSDVVGAVMKELRLQSGQPGSSFRLAVAVDGVNALWGRSTIKKEDKSFVRGPPNATRLAHPHASGSGHRRTHVFLCFASCQVDPEELTLIYNLRKLMRNDWVSVMKKRLTLKTIIISDFNVIYNCVFLKAGGAIITTLSQTGSLFTSREEYLPQELLGKVRNHFNIIFHD